MTTVSSSDDVPRITRLADLTPYLSITVLRIAGDRAIALDRLADFLHRAVSHKGRAADATLVSESKLSVEGGDAELGEYGIDFLYAATRVVHREPGWAGSDSGLLDVENELTIALSRNDLVVICGPTPSYAH